MLAVSMPADRAMYRAKVQPAHDAGDRVLQVTASRLRGTMRTSDFVAHLVGDEFVVVLPETATI